MIPEFNNLIKGLADKNTEKEKESKIMCDTWITQQLQKKDESSIDAFFEYIRSNSDQPQPQQATTLSLGALNAYGIFAHSIKSDDKLRDKYVPSILDTLIQSYFNNEANSRVRSFNYRLKES
jgi:hypothetical protein